MTDYERWMAFCDRHPKAVTIGASVVITGLIILAGAVEKFM